MAVQIKVQKDYYLTEVSVELPADIQQTDELLQATRTTGKMVVQYNQGSVQGVNLEQRTKISDAQAEEIRKILDVDETIL
jgi:hypothetical protein